ncbi:5-methyltetrahydropteroyltriglutamate--homocysteine S-methyltransferase [Patescibacteria group bacterium AH-259-L07]|nr:5-methyltetrahydropteroyltriglutamate--homocysteine S-methyltransferase [Patescibacteria group bacterium AH-259-L07]
METYAYGFPHYGTNREYKKLIEGFWDKKVSEEELRSGLESLERERIDLYQKYVDYFPSGEMTVYDPMLDMAVMLGIYTCENLDQYFYLCRGKNALDLTKWFNTDYHYLVPEISSIPSPSKVRSAKKRFKKLRVQEQGIPYLIGPFTFLKLSKVYEKDKFEQHLLALAEAYAELIQDYDLIHIDEPAFVQDITDHEKELIRRAYKIMNQAHKDIFLFTYYDSVDFLEELYQLPVKGIGLDLIYGSRNLDFILEHGFPDDKILIAGIVDGRRALWRTDIDKAVEMVNELSLYAPDFMISNASPLYHLPITIEGEEQLDSWLLEQLSFARERLYELQLISQVYEGEVEESPEWYTPRDQKYFTVDKQLQRRLKKLQEADFARSTPHTERVKIQKKVLNLPLFPTTTIGSYPQTKEVRKARAGFKSGRVSKQDYDTFVSEKISDLIRFQEDVGLDVLVHGEFERSDMVEFFAQKLNGIATTKNGWVISYGTRGYRPPIIYGDISRSEPMTVKEVAYAQSLTDKPVKGMLTGPVTIIAWSYVRDDIPIHEVAYSIALCHQDEIKDYEKNGIKIIQIDEPAFREKAPLKRRDWAAYFDWAIKAFRLASHAKPETQIHTHMCYSEFSEIIDYIVDMDFDVISIEAARSRADIIQVFSKIEFSRQIGLGVWDVHSPAVPAVSQMEAIVKEVAKVVPIENIWVNPDCGLKTRKWEETIASLKNLVKTAQRLRKKYTSS